MVQTTVRPVHTVFLTAFITIAAARASNPAATGSHIAIGKLVGTAPRQSDPVLLLCAAQQSFDHIGGQLQQDIHTDTGISSNAFRACDDCLR